MRFEWFDKYAVLFEKVPDCISFWPASCQCVERGDRCVVLQFEYGGSNWQYYLFFFEKDEVYLKGQIRDGVFQIYNHVSRLPRFANKKGDLTKMFKGFIFKAKVHHRCKEV